MNKTLVQRKKNLYNLFPLEPYGLMTHNFIKVSSRQTLAVTNNYDIICVTETFLDSSIDDDDYDDDDRMSILGYNLLRVEHPSNTKSRDVCVYYKDHLPIIKRKDLCQLHECLFTKLIIGKKTIFLYMLI